MVVSKPHVLIKSHSLIYMEENLKPTGIMVWGLSPAQDAGEAWEGLVSHWDVRAGKGFSARRALVTRMGRTEGAACPCALEVGCVPG